MNPTFEAVVSFLGFACLCGLCFGFHGHHHHLSKRQRKELVRHETHCRVSSSTSSKNNNNNVFKESLATSSWVKFIAGASNQDLSSIRNLCLIYSIAGVDCIDVSADPAVIAAAREGIDKAIELDPVNTFSPLLMISVNDEKDPHFRKAYFDPTICPSDCSRPCEVVCPAVAIKANTVGVIEDRCYGCGRCVPVCPYGFITTQNYEVSYEVINNLFLSGKVDAIEIHTQPNREVAFSNLWRKIASSVIDHAKVVAVSFPDMQSSTTDYLIQLNNIIGGTLLSLESNSTSSSSSSTRSFRGYEGYQIWQCDGRPMSGDIGRGTAHKAAEFASRVLDGLELEPLNETFRMGDRHFVQLAGGTNDYSVITAEDNKLFGREGFGGFAFGGYARKEINRILLSLEVPGKVLKIEEHDVEFDYCKTFAAKLVNGVKCR